MIGLDRRTFLLGAGAAGLTVACGGGDGDADQDADGATADALERSGEVEFLVPAFSDGFRGPPILAAGLAQRATFVVRDDLDTLRDLAPATIDLTISAADGSVISSGPVAARADGVITPLYPVVFTPTEPGQYQAAVPGIDPVPFVVADRREIDLVQVGDAMRPVATPTASDALGVDPICTRAVPCPFHDSSLDDVLGSGRPTVLLIATPGFCQTDSCGPVVDLLIDGAGERADLDVVHAEVYVDPSQFAAGTQPDTTPAVQTYALPFEPHLLVAAADDVVTARLDNAWDRSELTEALASLDRVS